MSTLKIQERFSVAAPPAAVWDFLVEPRQVVQCLPGATLDSSSEDGLTHEGTVKVKAGPVTVVYRGSAQFVEVAADDRRMRLEASGRERAGSGTVRMTMVSTVLDATAGAEVVVDAEVQLTGKIVTFGRGMMDAVAQQVFRDFTACLSRRLSESRETTAPVDTVSEEPGGSSASRGGSEPTSAAPADALGLLFRAFTAWLRRLFGQG